MMKFVCILAATAALFTSNSARADEISGHFSITGNLTNNNVFPTTGGPETLTFSYIANALDPTDSTGDFSTLLTPGETAPGTGSIPFITNGTETYSNVYLEFVNANPTDDLLVQITDLTETTTPIGTTGTNSYSYGGDVIFTTPNDSAYTATPGTFSFTSQDERMGPVTFSATGYALAPTPEPSSLVLLASGLAGAAGMIRRRMRK